MITFIQVHTSSYRACKKLLYPSTFPTAIQLLFIRTKPVQFPESGVVYQIPCRDCTGIYIGETGRAYKTRLAEHKRDLKPANLAKVDDNNFNKKTALVKHVITKDHRVDWDHSKILTFEIDFTKRRFLESFFCS